MLTQILIHTPIYVWAVLGGLVLLGLMQSRTRKVSALQVLAMPAVLLGLGLWSLSGVVAALPAVLLVWLAALGLGAAGGMRTPQAPGTAWLAGERRFVLPGSWIPMAFIVFVFVLRYASNVAAAIHPEWRAAPTTQLPLAAVFGLVSGLSVGRTITLLRLALRPATIGAHA